MTENKDSAAPSPDNASPLAQWLGRERKKRGLTRKEAASAAGMGLSIYACYEQGSRTPTKETLPKLIAAFGAPSADVTAWLSERRKASLAKKFFTRLENPTPLQSWLLEEREKRQKTKEEMSSACGFTSTMYGCYETGKRLPSDDALEKLRACLGSIPQSVQEWLAGQRKEVNRSRIKEQEYSAKSPLADWVIAERFKRRMTQQELAVAMGFRPSGLKELEQAVRLPRRPRLQKIIDYFGGIPPEVLEWYETAVAESRFKGFQNKTEELSPFGRIIRELRRKANMSMVDLADRLEKNKKSYVARLENGARRIPEAVVKDLAHIFGFPEVPPSWRKALTESEQDWHHRAERDDEELKPLGLELRRLRKLHFKSAEQLAARLNWPLWQVRQIELATASVNDERLLELAKAFGFKEIPYHWYALRRKSGQVCQGPQGDINDNLSPFGKLLRRWRQQRHVTQEAISQVLGMTNSYIHEVEYGRTTLTEERLSQILVFLGKNDEESRAEALARIAEGRQWRRLNGLQLDELPKKGRRYRAERLAMGLNLKEAAAERGTAEWVVAESERGRVLTWKEKQLRKANPPASVLRFSIDGVENDSDDEEV